MEKDWLHSPKEEKTVALSWEERGLRNMGRDEEEEGGFGDRAKLRLLAL